MIRILRMIQCLLPVLLIALPLRAAESEEQEQSPYIPSILIVESVDEVAELESQGVIVWHQRADMVLCAVPRSLSGSMKLKAPGRTRQLPRVSRRRITPTLDQARAYFEADRIHVGTDVLRPYTGKGVVVGFCDTGFDPNHITFLDADGVSRVRRLVSYNEPQGERIILDTPEEIAAWRTDNEGQWHGTHVAGALGGSYRGNQYYGMAPDADIVGCTSQLYDAGILAACEDIIDYAKSVGKPAVINLSLGSYNGPHDGTSLFSQYMELLGEDAIVCMSSGNEGASAGHNRIKFCDVKDFYRTRLLSKDWMQYDMIGMVDAWSHSTEPVSVRIAVYDNATNDASYVGEFYGGDCEFDVVLKMSEIPELTDIFTGEIEFCGYVSPFNGRWVTEAVYDIHTDVPYEPADGRWARYELAFDFAAGDDTVADFYSDQSGTRLRHWWGWPEPDNDMSISDLCTGKNVISVGMYTFRNSYPQLNGETITTPRTIGTVHQASSYGLFDDGTILPHTVGPGDIMVSAMNSAYAEAHPDKLPTAQAQAEVNGKIYYWVACNGTSMSCPFTAGTIACWLEANPNLTVEDVKNVLLQTNSHDYEDPTNPRHGNGWLDPYAGLKMVVSDTGITTPGTSDAGDVSAVFSGNNIEILNPGCREVSAEIYSAAGAMLRNLPKLSAPVMTYDISDLTQGVYVVRISATGSSPKSYKFMIKG